MPNLPLMTNNKRIAIIGGGIVGLYLAVKLQEKGFEVFLFEKNKEIGQKPRTALITKRIFEFLPEIFSLAQRKIEYIIAHFSKKDLRIEFKPELYLFERKKLDQFLAKLAQTRGVKIILGKEIKEIPEGFFRVIGCDGSLSKIRNLLGLPLPLWRFGFQYFCQKKNQEEVEVWFRKEIKGFFWQVPRKNLVEYGAMGESKKTYQDFVEFLKTKEPNFQKEKIKSALIPLGLVLPKNKKITLCGDAIGLTSPLSGGGIIWGLKAGEILLETFPDFLLYRKKIKKFFLPKIYKGKAISKLLFSLPLWVSCFFPKKVEIDTNLFYSFLRYKIYF